MKIYTANIGRDGMTSAKVRADFKRIKSEAGYKFIAFQEIDEADPANEHAILKSVFPTNKVAGRSTDNPIVGSKSAKLISNRVVRAIGGIKGITPNRSFTVSIWEIGGKQFVLINTHYPFLYHGKKKPLIVKAAWNKQFAKHKALVKKYHDLGYTVFWTGDVNKVDMPKVHPNERRLVFAGIDKISVVEGKYKVRLNKKGKFALNSDHDAKWVDVTLL